mmetsp:Transcript_23459/g.36141  ORF Transcript_23459/g.36141 Transcript_23459/m.36141 type:complete len:171 (+) Transcript_23459:863-1375(+)|eukprot:CAMPEP_0170491734 /NCGR_PEP_ID=MMETSP0208-20121228/11219_1 /TAXON_ID=197538 /ORGANISM="Strombidium inclinatum, Strain S3" /LENGTH=170 /DNA_ID=CAMNT_0010767355 /DNA_START=863 /DNA_END=1375 /DNA_ORIENTATION=+
MATNWFPDDQRALATALGSLSNPLGCIFGLALGPFFVFESDKDDHEAGKEHMRTFMLFCAVVGTLMSIPTLIFFREKPKYYPSKIAKNSMTKKKYSQVKDLKMLGRNCNYYLMVMTFMSLYGVYTCLGAVINNIVSPYGFTATDSSILGATFIVSGLIGSFYFSAMLDKQ